MMQEEYSPEVVQGQAEVARREDAIVNDAAPTGMFTKKALNRLVLQVKKLQPMFGLEADYPDFDEDVTQLPAEFVRMLSMIQASVADAVSSGVIDDDFMFDLDVLSDDNGLMELSLKLGQLAADKKYSKFLESSAAKPEAQGEPAAEEPKQEKSLDDLFMSRM